MKNVKPFVMSLIIFLIFHPGTSAHAENGDSRGNGTIVLLKPDGRKIPMGEILQSQRIPVDGICDLVDDDLNQEDAAPIPGATPRPAPLNSKLWKRTLNDVVLQLDHVLPTAADMLMKDFREMEIILLKLEDGERLAYTRDDGGIIDATKVNCAVRMPHLPTDFMDKQCRDDWQKSGQLRFMLQTAIHEALLADYNGNIYTETGTSGLDYVVGEILRLVGFYPKESGGAISSFFEKVRDKNDKKKISYSLKKPAEIAHILNIYGLSPHGLEDVASNFKVVLPQSSGANPIEFYNRDDFFAAMGGSLTVDYKRFDYWSNRLNVQKPPVLCPND